MRFKHLLLAGASLVAAAPVLAAPTARAQDEASDRETSLQDADRIVVIGQIPYRNRTEAIEPTLEFDAEYFQRFEPLTAGDALRRVPSVTFLSDVLESDGARFRGLAPSYTQVLINGERVPGGEQDRSFFLDRIPAELIERVEIVRSSSARRTGDSIAGALNIVLRDGYDLEGGYVRGGALLFDDGELRESFGLVYGGEVGPGRLLFGANVQGRYNPKEKKSLRYGDSPENNPNFATDDFDNREDQTDVRDGTDYSANARYTIDFGDDSAFDIGGYLTLTDREEAERSYEYEDPTAVSGPVPGGALLTDNQQLQEIEQINYTIDGSYERPLFGGVFDVRAAYSIFEGETDSNEDEIDFEDAEVGQERELEEVDDAELTLEASQAWELQPGFDMEVGLFWQDKERDTDINAGDQDVAFSGPWNQFSDAPFQLRTSIPAIEPIDAGLTTIEETRFDVYAVVNGAAGALSWEAGLRLETTDTTITHRTAPQSTDNDYTFLLPSASARYDLSPVDRITVSAARTVRRPDFNFLNPALLEGEFGDNDFFGDPELEPEESWGVDAGYERRIGRNGIIGVNTFYRLVDNLIEVANSELGQGSEGPGTFILTPQNTGTGEVWGVEFDVSTPLGFIGLPDTGLFGAYSYLDSRVDDIFGERQFNDQSDYVFNVGFIHSLPAYDAAFGLTYREQGDAFGRIVGEEVTTEYGADLEVFVEKSFFDRVTARVVGRNLLNATKDETFNKFDTVADQVTRDFDEYELESEEAGPVFQFIVRASF